MNRCLLNYIHENDNRMRQVVLHNSAFTLTQEEVAPVGYPVMLLYDEMIHSEYFYYCILNYSCCLVYDILYKTGRKVIF